MVAYTADQALNPEKKGQVVDGVEIEIQTTEKAPLTTTTTAGDHLLEESCGDEESADNVYNETTVPVVRQRRQAKQKRRLWLQLLLIAGMFLGLTLCVVGSIHLYKGMNGGGYKGRCGVGIIDMSGYNFTSLELSATTTESWERDVIRCGVIEDVEIFGSVETLTVPAQNKSVAATFRLDFDRNATAIRDDLLNLCFMVSFLSDFQSATVPSPAEFSDVLNSREADDSMPVVYEMDEYFNVGPAVDDMSEFGDVLADLCAGSPSYKLLPVSRPAPADILSAYDLLMAKKETTPAMPATTGAVTADGKLVDVWYKMYPGGNALFNYHLLMDDFLYNYDGEL